MSKAKVLVLEVALALLLNITGGLMGQHVAIELARWGWFGFLTHLSYVVADTASFKSILQKLRNRLGNTAVNLVAVIGVVAILYGYWTAIDAIFSRFFPPELKITFKYSKAFTSARKARIRKEMNSIRSYLMHIGFDIPTEGPALSYLDENDPPGHLGTSRSWSITLGTASVDDPATIRLLYTRFVFRRLFKVLEISDEDLTQMFAAPRSTGTGDFLLKSNMNDEASRIFANYFLSDYSGHIIALQPINKYTNEVNDWLLCFWEMRNGIDRDFTNNTLLFTYKYFFQPEPRENGNPMITPNVYLWTRFVRGEQEADSHNEHRERIQEIFKSHGIEGELP